MCRRKKLVSTYAYGVLSKKWQKQMVKSCLLYFLTSMGACRVDKFKDLFAALLWSQADSTQIRVHLCFEQQKHSSTVFGRCSITDSKVASHCMLLTTCDHHALQKPQKLTSVHNSFNLKNEREKSCFFMLWYKVDSNHQHESGSRLDYWAEWKLLRRNLTQERFAVCIQPIFQDSVSATHKAIMNRMDHAAALLVIWGHVQQQRDGIKKK